MMIDTIATHDAAEIKRLIQNGESMSTTAAGLGYTPSEAVKLLEYAQDHHNIVVGWWKETQ